MRIDGATELVGIIGYPIDYTLSPVIHNAAFRRLDMNWLYIPLRVPPGEVGQAIGGLRALGFRGANVTIPHKVDAVRFLDETRGEAGLLETVNTIVLENGKLIGYNTDVQGFKGFLRESGVGVRGASALLVGAGGASRAIALALAGEGASKLFIMNRTPERAWELAALLKRVTPHSEISIRTFDFEGSQVMSECDMVINCTPLANAERDELPLDYNRFREGQWAMDLNYARRSTAFLEEASARGAKTASGEGMLIHQAAASFNLWTGKVPPLEEMRKALSKAMSGD